MAAIRKCHHIWLYSQPPTTLEVLVMYYKKHKLWILDTSQDNQKETLAFL